MSSTRKTRRSQAIELRKKGASYNMIHRHLGISKSTLSSWLKNLSISSTVKNENINRAKRIWASNITEFNKLRGVNARLAAEGRIKRAAEEIEHLDQNTLKLIGTALYWAEGYKRTRWNPVFCNSDPEMIRLIMRFFRETCCVEENKFRAKVQIHKNVSKEEAEKFWSRISGIGIEYFRKPILSLPKSSKRKRNPRRLPYGTFRIEIADSKVLQRIKGWIHGISTAILLE